MSPNVLQYSGLGFRPVKPSVIDSSVVPLVVIATQAVFLPVLSFELLRNAALLRSSKIKVMHLSMDMKVYQ